MNNCGCECFRRWIFPLFNSYLPISLILFSECSFFIFVDLFSFQQCLLCLLSSIAVNSTRCKLRCYVVIRGLWNLCLLHCGIYWSAKVHTHCSLILWCYFFNVAAFSIHLSQEPIPLNFRWLFFFRHPSRFRSDNLILDLRTTSILKASAEELQDGRPLP